LGFPCPGHESESRKSHFITWNSFVLQNVHSTGFQSAITGDESWFFLYYPRYSIWALSRDEVPERVSQRIDTEKCLISLLWPVNGIDSPGDVQKGSTYNSALFCDTAIPNLFDGITSHSRRKSLKSLYTRLDNARPHNARRSTECLHIKTIQQIPHPADSSDLAPSDFLLFGYIKRKFTE
jgi:hypothetical protein